MERHRAGDWMLSALPTAPRLPVDIDDLVISTQSFNDESLDVCNYIQPTPTGRSRSPVKPTTRFTRAPTTTSQRPHHSVSSTNRSTALRQQQRRMFNTPLPQSQTNTTNNKRLSDERSNLVSDHLTAVRLWNSSSDDHDAQNEDEKYLTTTSQAHHGGTPAHSGYMYSNNPRRQLVYQPQPTPVSPAMYNQYSHRDNGISTSHRPMSQPLDLEDSVDAMNGDECEQASAEVDIMSARRDLMQLEAPPSQSSESRPMFDDTPRPLTLKGLPTPGGSEKLNYLRSVREIPESYQSVFKSFPYFNIVQSKVMDDVLYTDKPMVVCSPTGSGKTVIFELAIVRLLVRMKAEGDINSKIVYMAPIKALCSERYTDWQGKFGRLGLMCKEMTGDNEFNDYYDLQRANLILTTPEKWDSMTRKWKDDKSLVQCVRLFLVDEIHLLNDQTRGATVEAVVSRMKTVQTSICRERKKQNVVSGQAMRFLALSATIPNIEDIAEWLGSDDCPAVYHVFDDTHRPVHLRKVVLGFPFSQGMSDFRFDMSLSYKLSSVIRTYSDGKQTLVFCSTRKSTMQAANILLQDSKFKIDLQQKQTLQQHALSIRDTKLKELLIGAIAYHHAGMDVGDRKIVEQLFLDRYLSVLIATSTLAMGVNLPAHLVILKSTEYYNTGVYTEYSDTEILQMIGRAGRPQFDTTATAVIMTRQNLKHKYENLLSGHQYIESSLHKNLIEHLNAEVVLMTITDVSIALEWLKSTFLYTRILRNPQYYGAPPNASRNQLEAHLKEMCMRCIEQLSDINILKKHESTGLIPTEVGRLMARFYISFNSMKIFHSLTGGETLDELVGVLSKCEEFSDVTLRVNEKRVLNTLNKDKNRATIRFPMIGKIRNREMKVNCLVQAVFGCLPIQEFSLNQDITKIFRSAQRVSKCLSEYLMNSSNSFTLLISGLYLAKSCKARLWENSKHVARQLDRIGPALATAMVNAGLDSLEKISTTNPRNIELILNRNPPFGNSVIDNVKHLPQYDLSIQQKARYSYELSEVTVNVSLMNTELLGTRSTAGEAHYATLVIGDTDNTIIMKQKIMDKILLSTPVWSRNIKVKRALQGDVLTIYLISSTYVGLDIETSFAPMYMGAKRMTQPRNYPETSAPMVKTAAVSRDRNATEHVADTRQPCSHRCTNKLSCAHQCCKTGVYIQNKKVASQRVNNDVIMAGAMHSATVDPGNGSRSVGRSSKMDSFINEMHERRKEFVATPCRLKYNDSRLDRFRYNTEYKRRLQLSPQQQQQQKQLSYERQPNKIRRFDEYPPGGLSDEDYPFDNDENINPPTHRDEELICVDDIVEEDWFDDDFTLEDVLRDGSDSNWSTNNDVSHKPVHQTLETSRHGQTVPTHGQTVPTHGQTVPTHVPGRRFGRVFAWRSKSSQHRSSSQQNDGSQDTLTSSQQTYDPNTLNINQHQTPRERHPDFISAQHVMNSNNRGTTTVQVHDASYYTSPTDHMSPSYSPIETEFVNSSDEDGAIIHYNNALYNNGHCLTSDQSDNACASNEEYRPNDNQSVPTGCDDSIPVTDTDHTVCRHTDNGNTNLWYSLGTNNTKITERTSQNDYMNKFDSLFDDLF